MKKLVATTTNNASNMIAAFNLLDLLHLSRYGHNLDLMINKGLDCAQVQRALVCCHYLVELFHRSWKKARDLHEKQQTLGLPEHKILGDVVANTLGLNLSYDFSNTGATAGIKCCTC